MSLHHMVVAMDRHSLGDLVERVGAMALWGYKPVVEMGLQLEEGRLEHLWSDAEREAEQVALLDVHMAMVFVQEFQVASDEASMELVEEHSIQHQAAIVHRNREAPLQARNLAEVAKASLGSLP